MRCTWKRFTGVSAVRKVDYAKDGIFDGLRPFHLDGLAATLGESKYRLYRTNRLLINYCSLRSNLDGNNTGHLQEVKMVKTAAQRQADYRARRINSRPSADGDRRLNT